MKKLKLFGTFCQFLLSAGLLVSLILDMPLWEISIPVRGLAFLVLLWTAWDALNRTIQHSVEQFERTADTKTPLEPNPQGQYGERDTSELLIGNDKYKKRF